MTGGICPYVLPIVQDHACWFGHSKKPIVEQWIHLQQGSRLKSSLLTWVFSPLLEGFYVEGHGRTGMPSTSPHTPLAAGNFICASVVVIRTDGRSCDHVTSLSMHLSQHFQMAGEHSLIIRRRILEIKKDFPITPIMIIIIVNLLHIHMKDPGSWRKGITISSFLIKNRAKGI